MGSVIIGPDFFSKAKNDYSDWVWAFAREFMQNCIDCGSSNIDISIAYDGQYTKVTVENNGEPMTEEVLTGKLLAIGGSGKSFEGTVGGFGLAKLILYFCHHSYEIITGNLIVSGCGGNYDMTEASYHHGTKSTVYIEEDVTDKLTRAFSRFGRLAQWKGTFTLNGEVIDTSMRKGAPRRTFSFGKVYSNRSFNNLMIVRINGTPMFTRWIDFDKTIMVELNGTSGEVLTANRDGLRYEYQRELDNFVQLLAVDSLSALRDPTPEYDFYEGRKYSIFGEKQKAAAAALVSEVEIEEGEASVFEDLNEDSRNSTSNVTIPKHDAMNIYANIPEFTERQFVLKNTTGMEVPAYFQPASFSKYSKTLLRMWGNALERLFEHLEISGSFSIGFILDEERIAEYEDSAEYGRVFYINPAKVVTQVHSNSRSFTKRWNLTDRGSIISTAVHEMVHFLGYSTHNEGYAAKLTELFGVVYNKKSKIGAI